MNEKIKCSNCGRKIVNNPKKHLYRPKYCPTCRVPYTNSKTWLPTINFRNMGRDLQRMFSFIGSKRKDVVYVCASCGGSFSEGEFRITQVPDKVKDVMVNGQMQQIPLTYRQIPTCPHCKSKTYLNRRSKKRD